MRKNVEENSAEHKNVKHICFSTYLSYRLYTVGCLPTFSKVGEGGGRTVNIKSLGHDIWNYRGIKTENVFEGPFMGY